ncbi:MAG: Ig-like domain-containing protein [Bacilli bacterium]|jgi:hypothetical protein|nr:Ig-like domain-containing protein [Bacilli bacterium]
MKKISVLSTLALLGLLVSLASCGGTPTNSSQVNSSAISQNNSSSVVSSQSSTLTHVESLSLAAETTTIKEGENIQVNLTVLPENASDKSVVYSVSDQNILSVSTSGLVSGIKEGSGEVIATSNDGGKTARLAITVVKGGENAYLAIDDYAAALSKDPYTVTGLSGQAKYGLSQGDQVGVNASAIQERFPSKADSEFEAGRIIDYSKLTLNQIQTVVPGGEDNPLNRLQTAFSLAKDLADDTKFTKIKLPGGTLNLDTSNVSEAKAFNITGLKNTYIDGQGTNVVLNVGENLAWKGFLNLSNAKNVYFNDLTVDQGLPSNLTGVVSSVDTTNNAITVAVKNSFNPLVKAILKKNQTTNLALRSWVEFNASTLAPLQGGNFRVDDFYSYAISGDETSGYSIAVKFKTQINNPGKGSLASLQFTQYDAPMMNFADSEGIYLENLTIHHAAGMALTCESITGFYANRFNLSLIKGTEDLMTATADGMHFNQMHGDCQVTNSLIENSHDDALNIKHGYWYKLADAEGGSTKQMTAVKLTGSVTAPKVGDKVMVFDETSFEGHNPTQGYYTIASINVTSTSLVFTVNERMSSVADWGNCRVTFLSSTPSFVFKNNIVRNKRNRGILVQVPGADIENNSFINVGHGSIQAATSMDIYNEATLPSGITVKNNKFISNCYITPEPLYGDVSFFAISSNWTVAPAGTIKNATVENNFFTRNGNACMAFRGASDCSIKDNLFYECSRTQPSGETFNCLFFLYNGSGITMEGNYNQYTLEKGLSGIILQGLATESSVTLKDNYQVAFQVNNQAGPKVDVSKATGAISVDASLADWDQVNPLNIALDGYSDAEGNAVTPESIADHFKVNKLMMTYDDNGIYFGVDVFDNKIDVKTINDFWLGDCLELFMSTVVDMPNADMMVYKDQGGVLQAAFAPTWKSSSYYTLASQRTNSAYLTSSSKPLVAFNLTTTGYTSEIEIPFAMAPEFKTAIDSGSQIDIAFVVADCERADLGLKRVQVSNVPHFVENYKTKTQRMPQYFFK